MLKGNLLLFLLVCLTSVSASQDIKQNYKILFKSNCSISDAMSVLYNTYSDIVGDENAYDLEIEKTNFNFGTITLLLDNAPNAEQIHFLYENNNLVSFELKNIKIQHKLFREFMQKHINETRKPISIPPLPDYELILKYNLEANRDDEKRFLFWLFGSFGSYEKDANELVISIPEKESEIFIQTLKENDKVVFAQKL